MAAAMTVGLLAGCSSGGESGSDSGKLTLTFGSHQSGLPKSGIVQDLAKEYEEETGVKVDFQISPDAQWRDLIKVKLDSGEAPDIICVDTPIGLASSIHMDQYSVELTDTEWVKRMDERASSAVSVDGKTYGITFPGAKMYFYMYNKDIFEDLKLETPKNYSEFKDVCEKIKASGVTPVYECTTNGWHQVLPLFETGGLWLNDDPQVYDKLNANETPLESISHLETIIGQLQECAKAGYFGDDYLSNSWENAKEAIASGKYAMTVAELGFRGEVDADYPDFGAMEKLGAFVMPWGDNQTIGVNPASNAYFINKDSKHAEEAEKFFEFLAKPENLKKRLEGQPEINAVCWPEMETKYTEEDQAFLDSYEKANVVQTSVNYIDSQWMDVGKDLEAMYTGAMTPKDVVDTVVKRRNEQAELQKDPGWAK